MSNRAEKMPAGGAIAAPAGILHVSKDRVAALVDHGWGWRDTPLDLPAGRACFRTARLAAGMTATRSDCAVRQEFRSSVEHVGQVCILAFGLGGSSLFDFGHGDPSVVRAGDVWLFRANDATVRRRTPPQARATMVALKLDAGRVDEVLEGLRPHWSRAGTHALRLARDTEAGRALGPLLDNPLGSPLDRLRAESVVLGLVADWLSPVPAISPATPDGLCPHDRRAVERVVDALAADLADPPSLDALAALAGMSHARLNRCFRKVHGTSVFAWLRDYRLEVACRLLRGGEAASVTDIAFRCGFSSSSHLATALRQRFGCSPADYRGGR